jgi:Transposase DDE domain group 1
MTDSMLPLPGLSPVGGKTVVAKFDGGLLSSDAGILVLREVEQRLRVADRLAACMVDPSAAELITHPLAEIIRFRLLMIGAGYEDGNDASSLRSDPIFKMALDLSPSERELCSQSTISRLENLPDARSLLRMGRAMVDLYCESFQRVPKRITLDIDDTFDAVHGGQQLRLFNAHYDEYGFQPIVVFDGEGRFVTAVLRPAKRPGGKDVRAFLRRLLRSLGAGRAEAGSLGGIGHHVAYGNRRPIPPRARRVLLSLPTPWQNITERDSHHALPKDPEPRCAHNAPGLTLFELRE